MAESSEYAKQMALKIAQANAEISEKERVAETERQWREGLLGLASGAID